MKTYEKYLDEAIRVGDGISVEDSAQRKKLFKDYINAHKIAMNEVGRIKIILNNHRLTFMSKDFDLEKVKLAVNDLNRLNKYLHRAVIKF